MCNECYHSFCRLDYFQRILIYFLFFLVPSSYSIHCNFCSLKHFTKSIPIFHWRPVKKRCLRINLTLWIYPADKNKRFIITTIISFHYFPLRYHKPPSHRIDNNVHILCTTDLLRLYVSIKSFVSMFYGRVARCGKKLKPLWFIIESRKQHNLRGRGCSTLPTYKNLIAYLFKTWKIQNGRRLSGKALSLRYHRQPVRIKCIALIASWSSVYCTINLFSHIVWKKSSCSLIIFNWFISNSLAYISHCQRYQRLDEKPMC